MDSLEFNILKGFPEELIDLDVSEINKYLKGPVILDIDGIKPDALFLSVLLHGNEHSGFLAIQNVARHFKGKKWPRRTLLLIGNVSAAELNQRHLNGQPDYNRIWNTGSLPEHSWAEKVKSWVSCQSIMACVDIHNNTGRNPHYACVSRLDAGTLNLGLLFSRTMVYFTQPSSTLSVQFSNNNPAITIECGLSGSLESLTHIEQFIFDLLQLQSLSEHTVVPRDIDLYQTVARIVLSPKARVEFAQAPIEGDEVITLRSDLDTLNFSELEPGELIGYCNQPDLLSVQTPDGEPIVNDFIKCDRGQIVTSRMIIPSMFTLNKDVIFQDCLGYIMIPKAIN